MLASVRSPVRLAAALIALLLLSYASVRSTVMQVAMAAPSAAAPMCDGGMAIGADAMAAHAPHTGLQKGAQAPAKDCPYCAAAAQPPLPSQPFPLRSSTAVQFVAYRTRCLNVACGPPSRRPRVRDPPALVQSV